MRAPLVVLRHVLIVHKLHPIKPTRERTAAEPLSVTGGSTAYLTAVRLV